MNLKERLLNLKEKIIQSQQIDINPELKEAMKNTEIMLTPLTKMKLKELLENIVINFFPRTVSLLDMDFDNPNLYIIENLPFHLSDYYWIAKMIQVNNNLSHIDFDEILEFVRESSIFAEEKQKYEQRIIKCQLEFMVNNIEGINLSSISESRKLLVDALSVIGLDKQSIEENIEKNANLWSFSNGYTFPKYNNMGTPNIKQITLK